MAIPKKENHPVSSVWRRNYMIALINSAGVLVT